MYILHDILFWSDGSVVTTGVTIINFVSNAMREVGKEKIMKHTAFVSNALLVNKR